MDKNDWVLVADSAYARILERKDGMLHPVETFKHPESRERNNDLAGNRPNQNQSGMERDLKGGSGNHTLHDQEVERFAKSLAKLLDTAHSQNRFESLILVSEARFMGSLRGELSKSVAKCVKASINRHATQMTPLELFELISPPQAFAP